MARAAALQATLRAGWPGLTVEWVDRVDSTNTQLADRARRGSSNASPFEAVLIADEQTHGRGRMGRSWRSQPNRSLTFSLSVPIETADWSGFSLAVGATLVHALTEVQGVRVASNTATSDTLMLKWPNDMWLMSPDGRGRKLGGILIEGLSGAGAGGRRFAVIGIGINLHALAGDPAPEAAGGNAPRAADLYASGYGSVSEMWPDLHGDQLATTVLNAVLAPLLNAVRTFDARGFAPFAGQFNGFDLLRGREVRTLDVEGRVELRGIASGVDGGGALLIRTPRGIEAVASGEVSVRLDVAGPLGTVAARVESGTGSDTASGADGGANLGTKMSTDGRGC